MRPDWNDVRSVFRQGPNLSRRLRQRARALDAWQGRRPARIRLVFGLMAAGLAGLAALVFWPRVEVRDSSGAAIAGGTELVAVSERQLRFAEGSQLVLSAGTTARLEVVERRRVELEVVRGRLDAEVTKGTGRTWRCRAGEWTVRVVGTALSISWNPDQGAFELTVREGVVEVTGPSLTQPLFVRGGESFLRRRSASSSAEGPAPADLPSPTPPPPSPGSNSAAEAADSAPTIDLRSRPARRTPELTVPSTDIGAPERWRQLLAAGKRFEALAEAQGAGVLERPEQLSDADALALADAARLQRSNEISRRLLTQVRERRGSEAAEAAFLLGRLEAEFQRPEAAVASFRSSLELAPHGTFAEQARGRLMEALLVLDAPADAAAAAAEYQRHHPGGAWSGFAGQLLSRDGG